MSEVKPTKAHKGDQNLHSIINWARRTIYGADIIVNSTYRCLKVCVEILTIEKVNREVFGEMGDERVNSSMVEFAHTTST